MMKKFLKKSYIILPHILLAAVLASTALQAEFPKDTTGFTVLSVLLAAVEAALIIRRKKWSAYGITAIVYGLILIWSLYPVINGRESFLFPPPQRISAIFVLDILVILKSIVSSLWLLLLSFVIALILGIGLGMICGKVKRLQNVVMPIARVLSPVPALIYAPYVVAVMPNFTLAALFIITSGLFYPILINVIVTLQHFDPKLRDASDVMGLGLKSTIVNIYLPYCMPSLFNTLAMQISNAFLLLIGAELMGMDSGLGWYVKYNSDFSDYVRVIAGFIVIGMIIAVVNTGLQKLRAKILLWQSAEQ
ncbi:ABC transporter permease [uncultured Ruminococcus sp.]|uniref:ABC transporter permease n=1 Tax=uncultured Ruminococcus sp. TaxID=165186 RepID=UPI0025EBF746|nr:ABC transporter permease subunit [uncultured Ruminococcus sp.]